MIDFNQIPDMPTAPTHRHTWSEGVKTVIENCQMLCKDCNRQKSDK